MGQDRANYGPENEEQLEQKIGLTMGLKPKYWANKRPKDGPNDQI